MVKVVVCQVSSYKNFKISGDEIEILGHEVDTWVLGVFIYESDAKIAFENWYKNHVCKESESNRDWPVATFTISHHTVGSTDPSFENTYGLMNDSDF